MNNTKHKHDKQDYTHPHEDQQQKTRQQQETKKQGHKPDMLHKDANHQVQVHEHELPEMRMTR
jgi:hypothetical protein